MLSVAEVVNSFVKRVCKGNVLVSAVKVIALAIVPFVVVKLIVAMVMDMAVGGLGGRKTEIKLDFVGTGILGGKKNLVKKKFFRGIKKGNGDQKQKKKKKTA